MYIAVYRNVQWVSYLYLVIGKKMLGLKQGRIQGGAPSPKIGKNMIFWHKIVIFYTRYPKKFSRLPPLGAIFFKCAPLTWNPGSAPVNHLTCYMNCLIYRLVLSSCLDPLALLFWKTLKLLGFPIFWLWVLPGRRLFQKLVIMFTKFDTVISINNKLFLKNFEKRAKKNLQKKKEKIIDR